MIPGPDGYRRIGAPPAGVFSTTFDVLREQVDHGLLTTAGLIDAVRILQAYLFARAVPEDRLAECRAFVGHCNAELVARQRDGS